MFKNIEENFMRKIRIGSILLLIITTLAFTGFRIYEHINIDVKAPVISCPEEPLVISVDSDESEMLKGVTAKDEKAGDVSESVVVESLSDFTEDGVRTITYAAIDSRGNVSRKERELRYEDYKEPVFSLTEPLSYPIGKEINILERIKAESTLDGDLTENIKYSLEKKVDIMVAGKYPIVFRVMDSGGNTVYLETELEMYDAREERMDVRLREYIIYLNVNDTFDPYAYYSEASEEGRLEVQSSVDMSTPGVYHVDYVMHGERSLGKSRMIVVINGV